MKRNWILVFVFLLATCCFAGNACATDGLQDAVDKLNEKNQNLTTDPELKDILDKKRLISEYTSHLEKYPNDTKVMIEAGVIYLWLTSQAIEYYEKADGMFARALNLEPPSGPTISDAYIDHIVDRIDSQKPYWLNICFDSAVYADPSSKDRILERIRPFADAGNPTAIAYAFICAGGSEQEAYKQSLMAINDDQATSLSDYYRLEIAAVHTGDFDICLKAGQMAYQRMNDQYISAKDRNHIEERIKKFLTSDQYQTIFFETEPKFYKRYIGTGSEGGKFDDGTILTAEMGVDCEEGDLIVVKGRSFDVKENGKYITYNSSYEKPLKPNEIGPFFSVRAPMGVVFTVKVIDSRHQSKWTIVQGSKKSFKGKGIGNSENVLNIAQWGLEIAKGHKIVVRSSRDNFFYIGEGTEWQKCSGKYERIIDFNPLYGNWFQAYAEIGTTLHFHIERLPLD